MLHIRIFLASLVVVPSSALPWDLRNFQGPKLGRYEGNSIHGDNLLQRTINLVDRESLIYDENLERSMMEATTLAWVRRNSNWLGLEGLHIHGDPRQQLAIVTHAGKNHQEYIDMVVMLGLALRRYAPEYPRIALGIRGMLKMYQDLLERAGWQLLLVEDMDHCHGDCDLSFARRWKDSFEKLNAFRLPFGRILYLDADTYIFSDKIRILLNSTILDVVPEGHIAMAPDGCKRDTSGDIEYNSGVMLFKPDVDVFQSMLSLIAVRKMDAMLDQNIINAVYSGRQVEIDKKFGCIDPVGTPPGTHMLCNRTLTCKKGEVVISHFTGMFKPTTTDPRYLKLVQHPEAAEQTCWNTNHGGCAQWAEYYCALHANQASLSRELQLAIKTVGGCCLGKGHNNPECAFGDYGPLAGSVGSCPSVLKIKSGHHMQRPWMTALFKKSSIRPSVEHKYRPIFKTVLNSTKDLYLYYRQSKGNWMVGPTYTDDKGEARAHQDVMCPTDTTLWSVFSHQSWVPMDSLKIRAGTAPEEPEKPQEVLPTASPCSNSIRVRAGAEWPDDLPTRFAGTYYKIDVPPSTVGHARPVFQCDDCSFRIYLFWLPAKRNWIFGPNYTLDLGMTYSRGDSFCPQSNALWRFKRNGSWNRNAHIDIKELDIPQGPAGCPIHLKCAINNNTLFPWTGLFSQTSIAPSALHKHRPIFKFTNSSDAFYLYYLHHRGSWIMGANYTAEEGAAYAHQDVACPQDVTLWKTWTASGWVLDPSIKFKPRVAPEESSP